MQKSLRIASLSFLLCLSVSCPSQSAIDPTITISPVIGTGSIIQPTCMAFLSDNDILVGEKGTGRVKRVTNGVVNPTPVLDLLVNSNSERGLLGLVLDPSFATNNYVYVFYTRSNDVVDTSNFAGAADQRISRFTWNGTSLTSEFIVLPLPVTPGANHDGGILVFGPPNAAPQDQKLFAVIGDLNRTGKNQNYGSNADADDTGVILRINSDGTTPDQPGDQGPFYNVPGANASLQRTYAYGIRNSFGIGFDPVTNKLWQTENGPGDYDELNLVEPGFNSGWRYNMGPLSRNRLYGAPARFDYAGNTYSDPEFSWEETVAPTSIHFNRSAGMGLSYQYDCFVGDSKTGDLYRFEPNPTRDGFAFTSADLQDLVLDNPPESEIIFANGFGAITDIENSPNGDLHVLSLAFGQIYRLTSNASVSDWELY